MSADLRVTSATPGLGVEHLQVQQPDVAPTREEAYLRAILQELRNLRADLTRRHQDVWFRRLWRWLRRPAV